MCVFAGVFEKNGLQVWCFCGQFVVRCVANVVCKWALRRRGKCAIFFNFIFEGVTVRVSGGLAENKQGQRRRVGWLRLWWRSGFLRCAAHDEAVSRCGRSVYGGREGHSGRSAPRENAGVLRCAQNDDVKANNCNSNRQEQQQRQEQEQEEQQRQEQRRNTGISPLRRQSAPPSVEMTFVWWLRENRQRQKEEQRQKQIPTG